MKRKRSEFEKVEEEKKEESISFENVLKMRKDGSTINKKLIENIKNGDNENHPIQKKKKLMSSNRMFKEIDQEEEDAADSSNKNRYLHDHLQITKAILRFNELRLKNNINTFLSLKQTTQNDQTN